jgi:hypothetical protein
MAPQIALMEDGPGSYRFTFASARGEMSGRVTVGIERPPDKRSVADREQAAKNQTGSIKRVCRGLRRMTSKIAHDVDKATEPFDYTTDAELFSSTLSRRGVSH